MAAELASGAVSSLLGVIRNETRLLGGVQGDVQFIKEEMESMNSFLLFLARNVPPGGEHDEQVRAWMSQVRLLAVDCNNRIDLYLYRINPDIHLARGGLRRYLLWAPWYLSKIKARRSAATKLGQLKERAREIGNRRLRYGVEVPVNVAKATWAATTSSYTAASASGGKGLAMQEEEEDEGDLPAIDHSGRRSVFEPRSLEDYFEQKLLEWLEVVPLLPMRSPSMAIVAPDTRQEDEACSLVREALDALQMHHVLIDIAAVHNDPVPLQSKDVLYYILRELKAQQQEATSGQGEGEEQHAPLTQQVEQQSEYQAERERKSHISSDRKRMHSEISANIKKMKISQTLEGVKSKIRQEISGDQLLPYLGQLKGSKLEDKISKETLGVLLLLLKLSAADPEQRQVGKKKARRTIAAFYQDFIRATATKLKEQMEADEEQPAPTCLHQAQYEHILMEVFPKTSDSNDPEQDKDHIKEIANMVKQEIVREVFPILMTRNNKQLQLQDTVQESWEAVLDTKLTNDKKSDMKQATSQVDIQGQILDSMVKETMEKIENMKEKIEAQLKIKGVVDNIEEYLKCKTVIILKVDQKMDGSLWKETRRALSLLNYVACALIITTKSTYEAREYCYYPQREFTQWDPIEFSIVGLYHATVVELTSNKMQEENYIFRKILGNCGPHEFCMKIFAHAMSAKPMRSYEELYNLWSSLQEVASDKLDSIAQKMIKFSYNDLTSDYKSCLLYLAIFPRGQIIKRSILIGRWVVEGLITTEEWTWPSSVDKAKRCFDTLINRKLVFPVDIGATGDVKSCMVGHLVHDFITRVAKKQHTMQTHLSHHLARHFSISNDLRLRGSHTIHDFLKNPSESSPFILLKVLDLENCQCFGGKNKRYLKDICCKILLLKYLSLRRTDVTQLPKQINNLHELEVLDIRNTEVHEHVTRSVRLLKLKRLLAGQNDPSPSNNDTCKEFPSGVQVPDKIEKMLDMEVLSHVTVPKSRDLKNIGVLCNVRKLGVVIEDNDTHLKSLLVAISNMHECLKSLSITILPIDGQEGTTSSGTTLDDDYRREYPPKVLESLSIYGTTQKVQLLQKLLAEDGNQLSKVTLHSPKLNQGDLNVLAKLPKLICVRLRSKEYIQRKLTFKKDEFKNLKFFDVEGRNMTDISFEGGAAPELEKIVLSFIDNLNSLSGVNGLPKLKVFELKNTRLNTRLISLIDGAEQIAHMSLQGTFLRHVDLQIFASKPNLHTLMLLNKSCDESKLTFKQDEFPKLNLLVIDCSNITEINFTSGCTPKLKKIIWSFTKGAVVTLSGIDNLPKLKELEFNGESLPNGLEEDIKKHRNRPVVKHNK